MATKNLSNGKLNSKIKTFKQGSKMLGYEQLFDEDIQQNRTGFRVTDLRKTTDKVSNDETVWSVEPGYEYRSDLISNKFYGTAKYDWLIEQINDIKDPIKDLVVGYKLILPPQSKIINMV